MNIEADAVAGAVGQAGQFVAGAEAGVGNDLARRGVDGLARGAGFGGGQRGILRLALQGPDFFLARGGFAEDHGAGDVGLIAVHGAAIVEQNHVAFVQGLRHGAAVGEGGVLAEADGDAALEAKGAIGGADVVAELGRGHALAERGEAGAVGFDSYIGRALHERELGFGLDHAAAGGDRGRVDELGRGDLLAEAVKDGEMDLLFKGDAAGGDAAIFERLADGSEGSAGVGIGGDGAGDLDGIGQGLRAGDEPSKIALGGDDESGDLGGARAGEVEERRAALHEDGADLPAVHEAAGLFDAGAALVQGDGLDAGGHGLESADGVGDGRGRLLRAGERGKTECRCA